MEVTIKNKTVLIDEEHLDLLNSKVWYIDSNGYLTNNGSMVGGVRAKKIRFHRLVLDAPRGTEVDHINGNPLDNRICNLRIVSHRQNMINTKVRKDNTSGFRGVSRWGLKRKDGSKLYYWVSRIHVDGKKIMLGYFKNKEDAALAYEEAAREYYGEYIRQ